MATTMVMKKITNKCNAALPSCSINHFRADAAGRAPRLQTGEVHDDCQVRPFHLDAICRELGEETLDQLINSLQNDQNVTSEGQFI